jgi:glycosyltransferase involved in cell wall biosynthesis
MRVVQITPGAGDSFYCENCLRDNALVRALRSAKVDITMVPLYLPPLKETDEDRPDSPVFFGGINVYLQQKLWLFRHTPRWLDRIFDAPGLLRWAASMAGMTRAKDLGETTISMLEGENGRQVKELNLLVDHLAAYDRPDVVNLSNVMLVGLARRIRERLGCAVVSTLQDEDAFLDGLIEPYRSRAWEALSDRCAEIDAFVATCEYYRDVMTDRLSLDPAKVHVIHNGIDPTGYEPAPQRPDPPALGFLSPMTEFKGFGTLVDAYLLLRKRPELSDLRLELTGGVTGGQQRFHKRTLRRLYRHVPPDHVRVWDTFQRDSKCGFLQGVSVLSVPTTLPEASGLYMLEAMASGVPVVQPAHGVFPEVVEGTGGGLLCEPNNVEDLAEKLAELLLDPDRARRLGMTGRQAVLDTYNVTRAAREHVELFDRVAREHSEA